MVDQQSVARDRFFARRSLWRVWRFLLGLVTATVGMAAVGNAAALTSTESRSPAIEQRLAIVRKLLAEQDMLQQKATDEGDGDGHGGGRMAQWYNWGNWPNYWNNWPNYWRNY
jgi:hypothetical protein